MTNSERDAEGIEIDEWCWTDMIREYVDAQDKLAKAINQIMGGK
jgi:hypothetical protein